MSHMPKKRVPKDAQRKRRKIVLKKSTKPTGLVEVDDVLRKINYVQTERQPAKFKVSIEDSPVVNNILRDAGLIVVQTVTETHVVYEVDPGAPVEEGANALDGLEEISDEIPEDGQVFD